MYRRYYDGYGRVRKEPDCGQIIVPHPPDDTYCHDESSDKRCDVEISTQCSDKKNTILPFGLEMDDLLLIGVLIFLMTNSDGDDPLMPLIIGFVLISELM